MDLVLVCIFGFVFISYLLLLLFHPYYVENRRRLKEARKRYGFRPQNKRVIVFILLSVFFFAIAVAFLV